MTVAYRHALEDAVPQQRDHLRAAQWLWIQYRDANCLYYGTGEGTIARIEAGECMRSMTEARARVRRPRPSVRSAGWEFVNVSPT
jgi:uncharacterized protein YecT (DUF1311 family)